LSELSQLAENDIVSVAIVKKDKVQKKHWILIEPSEYVYSTRIKLSKVWELIHAATPDSWKEESRNETDQASKCEGKPDINQVRQVVRMLIDDEETVTARLSFIEGGNWAEKEFVGFQIAWNEQHKKDQRKPTKSTQTNKRANRIHESESELEDSKSESESESVSVSVSVSESVSESESESEPDQQEILNPVANISQAEEDPEPDDEVGTWSAVPAADEVEDILEDVGGVLVLEDFGGFWRSTGTAAQEPLSFVEDDVDNFDSESVDQHAKPNQISFETRSKRHSVLEIPDRAVSKVVDEIERRQIDDELDEALEDEDNTDGDYRPQDQLTRSGIARVDSSLAPNTTFESEPELSVLIQAPAMSEQTTRLILSRGLQNTSLKQLKEMFLRKMQSSLMADQLVVRVGDKVLGAVDDHMTLAVHGLSDGATLIVSLTSE
jgi:hypothetical protein